jgi:hypothetical protein
MADMEEELRAQMDAAAEAEAGMEDAFAQVRAHAGASLTNQAVFTP